MIILFLSDLLIGDENKVIAKYILDGGFKDVLFSPRKLGKDLQFDLRICFRWVGKNHQPVYFGFLQKPPGSVVEKKGFSYVLDGVCSPD